MAVQIFRNIWKYLDRRSVLGGGGKFSATLPQDFLGHFLKFSEKRTTVEQIRAKQGQGAIFWGFKFCVTV